MAGVKEENAVTNDVTRTTTDLPDAIVRLIDKDSFCVQLEKLTENLMFDQSTAMASATGCVSSPGGPSC